MTWQTLLLQGKIIDEIINVIINVSFTSSDFPCMFFLSHCSSTFNINFYQFIFTQDYPAFKNCVGIGCTRDGQVGGRSVG